MAVGRLLVVLHHLRRLLADSMAVGHLLVVLHHLRRLLADSMAVGHLRLQAIRHLRLLGVDVVAVVAGQAAEALQAAAGAEQAAEALQAAAGAEPGGEAVQGAAGGEAGRKWGRVPAMRRTGEAGRRWGYVLARKIGASVTLPTKSVDSRISSGCAMSPRSEKSPGTPRSSGICFRISSSAMPFMIAMKAVAAASLPARPRRQVLGADVTMDNIQRFTAAVIFSGMCILQTTAYFKHQKNT